MFPSSPGALSLFCWGAMAEGLAVQHLLLALIYLLAVCPPWAGVEGQVLGLAQAARCSF